MDSKQLYYALGLSMISVTSMAKVDNPNVVIIMTDEHNFRTLGCYREQLDEALAFPWGKDVAVETPHLDALAHGGLMCMNCYATNPVSGPSRSSFMTGLYPQVTGVDQNNKSLKSETVTFAELLSRSGYATGYVGKWHLDGDAKPGWTPKNKFGWADNLYMFNRGHWKKLADEDGQPVVAARDKKGNFTESTVAGADERSYTTDFLTDKAMNFIRNNKTKPFCCMLSLPDPHGRNIVRAPYDTQYASVQFERPYSASADVTGMPSWTEKSKRTIIDTPNGMSQYWGMVKCIDDNIGKLCQFLKNEGLYDNTIIIFTSDHGDLLGEHGRDNKSVPFEASAKIPCIWYYPSAIKPGTVLNTPISHSDFMPTLLGMVNVKNTQRCHGKDRSQLLLGKAADAGDIVTFRGGKGWMAATDGRYKLIITKGKTEIPVLYDLKNDPNEMKNIFSAESSKAHTKKLAQALKDYCISCEEPLWNEAKVKSEVEHIIKAQSRN